METLAYGVELSTTADPEAVIGEVKRAFKEQGFGALSEIDVEGALREKMGLEIGPYRILGMCNPKLASKAIEIEPNVGLLLPCNVLVRKDGRGSRVCVQDAGMMAQVTRNPDLKPIADEASRMLDSAMEEVRRALPKA